MSESSRERPKVVHLLTSDLSSVLVRGQLGFLADRGFDVTVGVGGSGAGTNESVAPWDEGVRIEHLPFARNIAVLHDLRALASTFRLLRRLRPDLVNASTPKAGLLGMLAARACRVRVRVYVIRGLRLETASGLKRRILRQAERLSVRCATHVLANSESVLRAARNERIVGPGLGEVIDAGSGNGVDLDRFTPASPGERDAARESLGIVGGDVVIAFVGRLTKDKGVADLVEVFTTRFSNSDDLRLLLVGDFEAADPLDDATQRTIGSDERIHRVAWLADTRDAFRAADVLAFPSYREGLPNAPLEAQASGIPVVGYAATGTVDAVVDGSTGVLVLTGDRRALGDALADVVEQPDRRRTMGTAARRHVEVHFDRRRVHEGLADRYERWLADADE